MPCNYEIIFFLIIFLQGVPMIHKRSGVYNSNSNSSSSSSSSSNSNSNYNNAPMVRTRFDPVYGEKDGSRDIYPNEDGTYNLFENENVEVRAAPMQHTGREIGREREEERKINNTYF